VNARDCLLLRQDTLREDCDESADCIRNCCVNRIIAPVFFVVFVLMAQFVLVNVVVAVLMKHLEVLQLTPLRSTRRCYIEAPYLLQAVLFSGGFVGSCVGVRS